MMEPTITWQDGVWHEGNVPLLGPMTHAVWMASTVFDGARAFRRLAPDLDRHCARAIRSAGIFRMTPPVTAEEMIELAWEGIEKFPEDAELYIRPMFYFEDGFVVPDLTTTRFLLSVFNAPLPPEKGIRACLSAFRRPTPETAPTGAKAACLYPNVGRAMSEAREKGFDTAMVLDSAGNVAEFATNNLFIVKDGIVQTPVENGCFLAGLTRKRVMELLSGDGHDVVERTLTVRNVLDADEVFLTGNYSKVQAVVQIEDREYQPGPVAKRARQLYFEFAEREGGR